VRVPGVARASSSMRRASAGLWRVRRVGDDGVKWKVAVVRGHGYVGRESPPYRYEVLLNGDDLSAPSRARRTSSKGNGRKVVMRRRHSLSRIATSIDDILDRASTDPSATMTVVASAFRRCAAAHRSRVQTPRRTVKRGREQLERVELAQVREVRTSVKASGPPSRRWRSGGRDRAPGAVRRSEGTRRRRPARARRCFDGVGEDEAVHADHYRDREFLGQTECWTCRSAASWLFREELDPAGVTRAMGRCDRSNVDRSADRPVARVSRSEAPAPPRCRRPPS